MKKNILILLFLLTNSLFSNEYVCKEHNQTLKVVEKGLEHINHNVYFNKILIKELQDNMWFIEKVQCTSNGFKLIASHIQYNNSTKKIFLLKMDKNKHYLLKSNSN